MDAVILNGSPRGERSVTGKLLQSLTGGLAEGGASFTEFRVAGMHIAPCRACLSCMHKHPGICAQKDDMEQIYARYKVADLLVVGTPVYTDNMSAQVKTVIDRSICCLQPFLVKDRVGRVRHPRWWSMPAKMLLVATAGFPEPETFDPLIATFRGQAANFGAEPLGHVCIPGSIALQMAPEKLTGHLELLSRLGAIIARTGGVDGEVLKALNTPALSADEYLKISASYEAWCSKRLGVEKPR